MLGVLLRYPNMAMTSHDLAGRAGLAQADGGRALTDLASLGLVEEMRLAGTDFYRLTREGHQCDELRELQEWHIEWQSQADRLFEVPGPGPGHEAMVGRK